MRTAMIVFASEQLWPNLSGLLHWYQESGVNALYIYHTADLQRSEQPAARLERLCKKVFPRLEVVRLDRPGGITPQEVEAQIRSWQRERGTEWHWVINATGGLKLMFAGGMACVGAEDCQVIYRELSGQWYELERKEDSKSLYVREFDIPLEETDTIQVADLVEMQFDAPPGTGWRLTQTRLLPVAEITRCGIACSWNWRDAFSRAGVASNQKAGFLFEQYMAATLLSFGVKNCALNLELRREEDKRETALNEIDVVANHKGRLLILDCKLRSEDQEGDTALTDQIARAAALQRTLGGLAAQCVLVRPNRDFTETHRAYAQASRLQVLDRRDNPHLFTRLGEILKLPLSEELQCAQRLLEGAQGTGNPPFSRVSDLLGQKKHESSMSEDGFLDMEKMSLRYMEEMGQDWFCFFWKGRFYLRWKLPKYGRSRSREDICTSVKNQIGFFNVDTVNISPSGEMIHLVLMLRTEKGMRQKAAAFFAARRGKPFVEIAEDRS